MKKDMVDVSNLTTTARKKIERIIAPRDTTLSLRFNAADVKSWKKAAGKETLSDWIERILNVAAR